MRRSVLFFTFVLGAVGLCACGPDPGPEPEPVATTPAEPTLRPSPPPGAGQLVDMGADEHVPSYSIPKRELELEHAELSARVLSEPSPELQCLSLPDCARARYVPSHGPGRP